MYVWLPRGQTGPRWPCRQVTCILSRTPVLSILLATFTVLPQMSYCGFWAPMTPAITGPWFIPVTHQNGVTTIQVTATVFNRNILLDHLESSLLNLISPRNSRARKKNFSNFIISKMSKYVSFFSPLLDLDPWLYVHLSLFYNNIKLVML